MFEKGYFKLTKFFSNSRNVLTTTLEERLNEKIKKASSGRKGTNHSIGH